MSDWQRLNLTDEQMEVLAHLTLKRDTPTTELLSDIWPTLPAEDAPFVSRVLWMESTVQRPTRPTSSGV